MGHYCSICARTRPNEKFSGKGHRTHVCKDCARIPKPNKDAIEQEEEIFKYLQQSRISAKNTACRGQTMANTFRDKLGSAAAQCNRCAAKEIAP